MYLKNSLKISIIITICCIFIFIIFIQYIPTEKQKAVVIIQTPQGAVSFHCTIADDDATRYKGLQGINKLEQYSGMLFVYQTAKPRVFTMKKMQIPLDIIFINEHNKILKIVEAEISQENIESNAPAQYVLEINKGICKQYNITKGISVDITLPDTDS